jgi:hypothetical protein
MKNRFVGAALTILMLVTVCPSYSQDQVEQGCQRVWQSLGFIEALSFLMPDFDKYTFEVDAFGGEPVLCEWPTVPCPNGECRVGGCG